MTIDKDLFCIIETSYGFRQILEVHSVKLNEISS